VATAFVGEEEIIEFIHHRGVIIIVDSVIMDLVTIIMDWVTIIMDLVIIIMDLVIIIMDLVIIIMGLVIVMEVEVGVQEEGDVQAVEDDDNISLK
jgi:hypothetical protein